MHDSGNAIRIRGARTHNLRNLSLDLPRGAFIVITGPSGSGKSSLAFDTIFAEGRRRFLETLRGDKRTLVHELQRPDVDAIDGLPPVVCVSQQTTQARPRSTLATITEIHDHLRLLWSRFGTAYCPNCDLPIHKQTLGEIVTAVMKQEGRKIFILAPLVQQQPGPHKEAFQRIRTSGFLRARVDGVVMEIRDTPSLEVKQPHTIELIIDRLIVKPGIEERLREALTTAVQHSGGRVIVSDVETGDWIDDVYGTKYACAKCGAQVPDLEPRDFSFNNPHGACPRCTGYGQVWEFDPKLIVPDRAWSLERVMARLQELAPEGASLPSPSVLTEKVVGSEEAASLPSPPVLRGRGAGGEGAEPSATSPLAAWPDAAFNDLVDQLIGILRSWADLLGDDAAFPELAGFVLCPECNGARLKRDARAVRFAGKHLHEITALSVDAALAFFAPLAQSDDRTHPARNTLLAEIAQRLAFLREVGLGYLTLDRPAQSLSGGEAQRARLATHLGGGLLGVCIILDEPTMGLHPRDTQRLIDALRALQARGNTVIVVEHDESVIRQADWLIDIGPGAGKNGGHLLAAGPAQDALANPNSITGRSLHGSSAGADGAAFPPSPPVLRGRGAGGEGAAPAMPPPLPGKPLTVVGARHHNLKNITVAIPLGRLTCLTGVSGSGKSSLARDILIHAARRHLGLLAPAPGLHDRIDGLDAFDKVLEVDQKPLGRSSRSNPATYVGIWDEIRALFATTRLAKIRGYKANRFSFNAKAGRCEECQGNGVIRVEQEFDPDLRVPCPVCHGKRFNAGTLEVRYRGLSIADVLDLPIADARAFFANVPTVQPGLAALDEVGLGYLALGQPASTLSGGEAQRVKLAAELGKPSHGKTLYLFDEPTTGLHFVDVARLITVLRRLVDAGNTVLVIEHHLDLIAAADWVIDLGPEGGDAGGQLLCAGTPHDIARCERSITGRYLRDRIQS